MKIERIWREGEDNLKIVFSRDGHVVTKNVWLGGAVKATRSPNTVAFGILRAAREADRDIAFKTHGKEFRKHTEFQSNFWGWLSADEATKLEISILCKKES